METGRPISVRACSTRGPAHPPAGQGGIYVQPGQLVVCEGSEPGGLAIQLRYPQSVAEQPLPLGGDLQGEKGVRQPGQSQFGLPGGVVDGAQPRGQSASR